MKLNEILIDNVEMLIQSECTSYVINAMKKQRLIIELKIRLNQIYENFEYAFREVHYVTIKVSFNNEKLHDIYIDFENPIIIINRNFLQKYISHL